MIIRNAYSLFPYQAVVPDPAQQPTLTTVTTEAIVVPVVYGKFPVDGNVLWFGNISNGVINGSFSVVVSSRWYFGLWVGICMGTINTLDVLMNDNLLVADKDYLVANFNDGENGVYPYLIDQAGIALQYISPMPGISHLWFGGTNSLPLNPSGTVPSVKFRPHRALVTDVTWTQPIVEPAIDIFYDRNKGTGYEPVWVQCGNNPASIIYDLLTNKQWGCGIDSSLIDLTSFNNVAQFMSDKGYGLNFKMDSQTTAREVINKIQKWVDVTLTIDSISGLFVLQALNPNDAVKATFDNANDNYTDFQISQQSIKSLNNDFSGSFVDMASNYTDTQLHIKNEALIDQVGLTQHLDVDLSGFNNKWIASVRLNEVMQRESFPKTNIQFTTNESYFALNNGDLIRVINSEYGLDDYFRITSTNPGQLESSTITFQAITASELKANGSALVTSSRLGEVITYGSATTDQQGLTFPPFSNLSNAKTVAFTTDNKSVVAWGPNQSMSGLLVYTDDSNFTANPDGQGNNAANSDYAVIGHNQIKLNPTRWHSVIQANSLGLLNVNVGQG